MSVHYKVQDEFIMVFGKTYPHRQAIRNLGGKFLGQQKVWQIRLTDGALHQIEQLCKATGGAKMLTQEGQTTDVAPPAEPKEAPPKPEKQFLDQYLGKISSPNTGSAHSKDSISISELMNQLGGVVQRAFSRPIWVRAEIQNLNDRGRGVFLSLAEGIQGANEAATTTINATIWSNQLERMYSKHGRKVVGDILKDGMEVRVQCQVNLYKGRGSISLQIQDIDPDFTKGSLALAREKLLKDLRAKGLDKKNKALPLPVLPLFIGLISAAGSRAESDFSHQLMTGGYPGKVVFLPTPMQGENVPAKVAAGIDSLANLGVDAIVITRGGGSAADLRWFDAPEIALAIADAPVPILSAIGHHDDYCVAEEISYRREKTPTAMAEFFLGCLGEYVERAKSATNRIGLLAERQLSQESQRQANLGQQILEQSHHNLNRHHVFLQNASHRISSIAQSTTHRIEVALQNFNNRIIMAGTQVLEHKLAQCRSYGVSIQRAAQGSLESYSEKLNSIDRMLVSIDPKPWLTKGWTQLFSSSKPKEPIASIEQLLTDDRVDARLLDGVLHLRVEKKTTRKPLETDTNE